MPAPSPSSIFDRAVQAHQAGRLDEAERAYRQVLAAHADQPDALQMLGTVLAQTGRAEQGMELIRRAIRIRPDVAAYHNNLGFVLVGRKRLAEGAESFRRAASLRPDWADAHANLGNALHDLGRFDEAIASLRRAIALQPRSAPLYAKLAVSLREARRFEEAAGALESAIRLEPKSAELHNRLATALLSCGRWEPAAAAARRALELRADFPEAYHNLGNALHEAGRPSEAIDAYRRALELRPDYGEVGNNLANVLRETKRLDEAVECYRRALAGGFDVPALHANLGSALKDMGELDAAIDCCRRALAAGPYPMAASNLLYSLHFHPDSTAESIRDEHARWSREYAEPLQTAPAVHRNVPDPERRLKIGCVSPDFRHHPVGFFLQPLLAHHDHGRFEIVCYSDVRRPDAMTRTLLASADAVHRTMTLSDERLAERIREDGIDVLIDLTMHMAGSRLLAFARRPAPVQVTWLAYCSTTGLKAIDWRLTDPYLDPPDRDESVYAERSFRLRSYWCYAPPPMELPVRPPAGAEDGALTFGCMNNYCKITPRTLVVWSEILRNVPNSRLLIHSGEGSHRAVALDRIAKEGVDPNRIEFVGFLPWPDYLSACGRIDIALDTFPYTGGTTTCDALWTGSPVVSLAGETAFSRGGLSILSLIGLPELVARSEPEYVRIAVELAGDLPRLAELRRTMRDRMRGSPLMDAPGFARDIEAAFRFMWRDWCERVRRA